MREEITCPKSFSTRSFICLSFICLLRFGRFYTRPLDFQSHLFPIYHKLSHYHTMQVYFSHLLNVLLFFIITFYPYPYPFISLLLQREGRRERNIDVREKHWLIAFSYVPQLGIEPIIWVCALIGSQWDNAPTNWTTLARAVIILTFAFEISFKVRNY